MEKELAKFYREIEIEIARHGPYSHNIVSVVLRQIARRYGRGSANKTITKFHLGREFHIERRRGRI